MTPINDQCRCTGPEWAAGDDHDPECVIARACPGGRWEDLEHEVVKRIRALAHMMECDAMNEVQARLYTDLVLPNVRLLAQFCMNVTLETEEKEKEE